MDNDLRITETVVYLYTYSSGNHLDQCIFALTSFDSKFGFGLFMVFFITWPCHDSQGIQDRFGAKSANWLTGQLAVGLVNLVSNFPRPSSMKRG